MRKPVVNFKYTPPPPTPIDLVITSEVFRDTLLKVQDALLSHTINGGERRLSMTRVCVISGCGTAACIGGWASIFLLGFEAKSLHEREAVGRLFELFLQEFDTGRKYLRRLFFDFEGTDNYDEPNVAATAIQRYLDGMNPWPKGKMPNVLRYKRAKKAAK